MTDKFILQDRKPVPCDDLLAWGKWLESADRHVAKDSKGDVRVSTVFIGLDHNFGDGPPLLFETMIFGGEHDQYQDRYSTWDEAEAGHKKACALAGFEPQGEPMRQAIDRAALHYSLEDMEMFCALAGAETIEAILPEEPPYAALKALAGDPLILAASDEEWARGRYKAMREALIDPRHDAAHERGPTKE